MKLAKCAARIFDWPARLAYSIGSIDHVMAVGEHRQRDRAGEGKPAGTQMQVPQERLALHDPLAGVQVGNVLADQVAGKTIQHPLGRPPNPRHARRRQFARADDHVGIAEPGVEPRNRLGRIGTVGVDDHDVLGPRRQDAGLQRGAVTAIPRMRNHPRAGFGSALSRPIRRAVVHDDDFSGRAEAIEHFAKLHERIANALGFVVSRHDHCQRRRQSHSAISNRNLRYWHRHSH